VLSPFESLEEALRAASNGRKHYPRTIKPVKEAASEAADVVAAGADILLSPAEALDKALHKASGKHPRDLEARTFPLFFPPPPLVAGAIIAHEAADAFEDALRGPYYDEYDGRDDDYYYDNHF
jgi:hypothetical protein